MHVSDFSYRFFMFHMTEEDVIEFIKDFEPDDESEASLQYERIDISERIDTNKTSLSKECMLCHYWYFKDLEFKFKLSVCNECSKDVSFGKQKELKYKSILLHLLLKKIVTIIHNFFTSMRV